MKLIVFSKMFKDKNPEDLVNLAQEYGFDGYDLCVRPGYPVSPDNADEKLKEVSKLFEQNGLSIPMVTAPGDLLFPEHPAAEPILAAMDKANIRLFKLGYFKFDALTQDYWEEVDKIRRAFEEWQKLAKRYNIRICYHTHSNRCMGLNCSALAHLINGFDSKYIGAYIDPGHMTVEGEEFSFGTAIIKKYLSIIALKDVLLERETHGGHGKVVSKWVKAGEGMVDWTAVFSELTRLGFNGPLSVHCEFEVPANEFLNAFKHEINFFKNKLDQSTREK
ncbi:sugar phosphate isomerase/epimerase [bacterium]|nr:sugar phosphate isomerase/epimerase [bacterium]